MLCVKLRFEAVLPAIILACQFAPPLAGPALAATLPSAAQVSHTINSAKILAPGYQASAWCGGDGLFTVQLYRNPKANDNDLKIDSVLITKTLYDKYPDALKSVLVKFFDPGRPTFKQVTIPEGLIKRFAGGELSQQALLDVIAVTSGGQGGGVGGSNVSLAAILNYKVLEGPKYEDRYSLYLRLRKLAKANWNVSKLFGTFQIVDQKLRRGDEDLTDYNNLFLNVQKEEIAYDVKSSETMSKQRLQKAELDSKLALQTHSPRFGFAYTRRMAIWQQMRALANANKDISWHMAAFQDIEHGLHGDPEALKLKIMQLEKQLSIPVSDSW